MSQKMLLVSRVLLHEEKGVVNGGLTKKVRKITMNPRDYEINNRRLFVMYERLVRK